MITHELRKRMGTFVPSASLVLVGEKGISLASKFIRMAARSLIVLSSLRPEVHDRTHTWFFNQSFVYTSCI